MTKSVASKDWGPSIQTFTDGSHRSYPQVPRLLGMQPAFGPSFSDSGHAFLNIVKRGGQNANYAPCPWLTANASNVNGDTAEEQFVQLDANGYPTSLTAANIGNGAPGVQAFTYLTMPVQFAGSTLAPGQTNIYKPGVYRLKYIGQGTVRVRGDATLTLSNSSASTYVTGTFNVVTPTSTSGIYLDITAVTSGTDNPRDISIVHTAWTSLYDAGEIYTPDYLALYNGISVFRGMQWQHDTQGRGYFGVASRTWTAGDTTADMSPKTWNYPTGTYPLWVFGGQSFNATFTFGSSAIVLNGTVGTTVTGIGYALTPPGGWAQRSTLASVSWSAHPCGVPYEAQIALANKLGADYVSTMRLDITDSDYQNLITLVDTDLAPGRKHYAELANEVWNGIYAENHVAQMFGCAQWGAQANDYQQNRNWYGMRCAVLSEIAFSTLGSSKVPSRCVPMVAFHGGVQSDLTAAMNTAYWTAAIDGFTGPASAHHIGIAAANFYWPNFAGRPATGGFTFFSVADATTMVGVATPLDDFFACMNGNVGTVANGSHVYSSLSNVGFGGLTYSGWLPNEHSDALNNQAAAALYGIPLMAYEGGDNFFADDSLVVGWAALVTAAEADARMGTAYRQALDWWATNIGASHPLVLFDDAQFPGVNGSFGVVQSVMQTFNSTNTPKWQAVQNFTAGL